MPGLIIIGTLNQYTFGNSIVAANEAAKIIYDLPIDKIFIIHSKESKKELDEKNDWKAHIKEQGVQTDEIYPKVLEFESDEASIMQLIKHIEFIINGIGGQEEMMIDLSNGTTVQKNLLSIVGFVLDLKNQYMIDISKLFKLTEKRNFIEKELLLESYIKPPDSTLLDKISYLNLSEIFRYKKVINATTNKYHDIDINNSDEPYFKGNLIEAIKLKLDGDQRKRKDNAVYSIASSTISRSVEELMSQLIRKHIGNVGKKTLGEKIKMINQRVKRTHNKDFDIEFFHRFNEFMLYLRNSTTHKGQALSDIEKFKAELSVKMSFPYIDFYTDIVHPILSQNQEDTLPDKFEVITRNENDESIGLYYGLDGDDTGKILENIFIEAVDEDRFRQTSASIKRALEEISKIIKDKENNKEAVVFEAGDDLLFKGSFSYEELKKFQKIYNDKTRGLTCSIGYGKSFHEVYLAMKLAKSQPGKNSIIGVEIKNSAPNKAHDNHAT